MASFVLVHGAWHGGWCWARVARLLRDAGHDVFTPTLTGLGERAHLARPEIDLAHHVQDVLAVLEAEELKSVTLCGHSYGGMVVTGVAARAAARVAHLVYLDAFVPAPGQALLDLTAPERAEAMREAARSQGEGWRVPPWKPEQYGVTSARDIEWLGRRLTPHPLRTLEQAAEAGPPAKVKLSYVYCAKTATRSFDQFAGRLREDRKWSFHELKTGHDAMVTTPGDVARILMNR